ncbi:uncharacterized protein BYT42DRAFT_576249 [Radiomyces spectabilis]|uniref:uncharacterized protein n=1 Tax=Radiomyces spectabilis TaxID=64574 RepID=UPI00221F3A5C|nr:uncharacterized protein BYT42DRAFT_576249 [Radiomyces spectabilis]KAI8374404.1 hypothetical protein BYT42DRAFT_576249 [Radiomyces spectabilis]
MVTKSVAKAVTKSTRKGHSEGHGKPNGWPKVPGERPKRSLTGEGPESLTRHPRTRSRNERQKRAGDQNWPGERPERAPARWPNDRPGMAKSTSERAQRTRARNKHQNRKPPKAEG